MPIEQVAPECTRLVDLDGNLYCTGPGGVWIIDPSGKHLGTIALGDGRWATNVGWVEAIGRPCSSPPSTSWRASA